jgi:hypothetical protein
MLRAPRQGVPGGDESSSQGELCGRVNLRAEFAHQVFHRTRTPKRRYRQESEQGKTRIVQNSYTERSNAGAGRSVRRGPFIFANLSG